MATPPKMKKFDFFVKGEKVFSRNLNVTDNITEEEEYVIGLDDPLFRDVIRAGQTLACDLTEGLDETYRFKAIITNQPPREYEKQEFSEDDIDVDNWCWANLKDNDNKRYLVGKFIDKWAITGFPVAGDANARGTVAVTGRTDIIRELKGLAVNQVKIALSKTGEAYTGTFPLNRPAPSQLPKDRLYGLKLVVVGDLGATIVANPSGKGAISSIECTAFKVSNKTYTIETKDIVGNTCTLQVTGDYSNTLEGVEEGSTVSNLVPGLKLTMKADFEGMAGTQTVTISVASIGVVPITSSNVLSNGNLNITTLEIQNAGIVVPQFAFLVYAFDTKANPGVYPTITPDSFFD